MCIRDREWGDIPVFDMIINATSIGLNKDDKINLDFYKMGKNKLFYENAARIYKIKL